MLRYCPISWSLCNSHHNNNNNNEIPPTEVVLKWWISVTEHSYAVPFLWYQPTMSRSSGTSYAATFSNTDISLKQLPYTFRLPSQDLFGLLKCSSQEDHCDQTAIYRSGVYRGGTNFLVWRSFSTLRLTNFILILLSTVTKIKKRIQER